MFSHLQSRSYGLINKRKLYNSANGNLDFIQRLKLEKKLTVHSGCVNTICWNETGTTLLSGSDDQYLVISDPFNEKTLHKLHSGHRANIFSAKYLPSTDDTELISCSGDGKIIYNNVLREDTYGTNVFNCHFGTTYEVITIPNEASTFLSCGEDGTVRFYDLRAKTSCTKSECKDDVLINSRSAVTAIAANPLLPWQLAVGCSDSTARVYDRRMLGTRATGNYKGKGITGLVSLFTPPSLESMSYRITSLNYSPDGEDMLVSYSSEYIYLYGTKDPSKSGQLSKSLAQSTVKHETNREDCSVQPEPGTSTGVRDEDVDDNNDTGARPSSVKRLRLRGDWSDTGPGARPERERRQNPQPSVSHQPEEGTAENPRITIMQRMSDLLTRWLDGNLRQNPEEGHQPENLADVGNQSSVSVPPGGQMSETQQPGGVSDTTQGEGQSADTQPRVRILEDIVYTDSDEANVNEETMEAVDSKSNVDEHQTEQACTTTVDNVNQEETDQTDNVMYNPLEPTSYIHQHKSHIDTSDGAGPSCSRDDISQTDLSVQPGSSISGQASQAECNVGRSASPPEERAIMAQTQQAVDELKNRNVAPIISLHYSTEGTSYSNIRLRFASLGSHTDTETDNWEGSSTGLHLDVTPGGHQAVNEDSRRSEVGNENVSGASSRSQIDSSEGPIDTGQTTTKQTGSESLHTDDTQIDMKHGRADIDHTHIVIDNSEGDCRPDSCDAVDNNQRTVISETSMNLDKDETSAMDISDTETEQTTHNNEHIEDNDKALVTESQSSSVSADDKVCDSSDNVRDESRLAVIEDSAEASCSGVGHRSDIGEVTECTMDTVPALQPDVGDKHDNDEDRMHVDDSTHSAEQSEKQRPQTQPSQRRRRIGYSGPPTGNFTLPSADDRHNSSSSSSSSSDDDNDDDVEPRNVLQRPRIDRTTAALRLQAFHRKRQEAKERREMDDKSIYKPKLRKVYKGHRNARTMIKEANFWGNNFIVSGSDCGHIFIWDRHSSEPVMLLEADKHVVNCVQPHPYDVLLASSGIDYDIKLWSPLHEKSAYDEERTREVMHRNQIMLEETRDTITVPAAFMLRVLASINNIRSGRRTDRSEAGGSEAGQGREETDSD